MINLTRFHFFYKVAFKKDKKFLVSKMTCFAVNTYIKNLYNKTFTLLSSFDSKHKSIKTNF
jgi:hypothetical protein